DIDRFTYKVFNTWGIGKDDVDNGILLVTVINDRAFRIETGNGVEGVLTDYEAKLVTESNLVPNFRNQNYYQGFTDTVTDLKLFLEEDPSIKSKYEKIASKSDNTPAYSFFWSFGLAVIFSIILESIFKKDKSRKSAKRISGAGLFLGGVALLALGFIATLGITFAITGILLFIFSSKSSGGGSGGLPFLFMGGGGSGGFGGSSGGFGGGFGGFGGGGSSGGGFSGGW
ncbi:TPM domain-containing protein, partial [Patescibacteria group bacterium]|nr:TPM domain-containing protein [Patescibacteria group bacterium]